MVHSIHTSPHVYTTVEADVTNLVEIRKRNKDEFKLRAGVSLAKTGVQQAAIVTEDD